MFAISFVLRKIYLPPASMCSECLKPRPELNKTFKS